MVLVAYINSRTEEASACCKMGVDWGVGVEWWFGVTRSAKADEGESPVGRAVEWGGWVRSRCLHQTRISADRWGGGARFC